MTLDRRTFKLSGGAIAYAKWLWRGYLPVFGKDSQLTATEPMKKASAEYGRREQPCLEQRARKIAIL